MSLATRIPEALLEELEKRFPDQCPSIEDSERMIWLKAGRVDVLRFLRKQYELQNRNILNPETDNPEEED